MIKKAILYIEKFVNDVIESKDPFEADPIKGAYEEGSQDVAENIKNGLEGLGELFSIYEGSPFSKDKSGWDEIATALDPERSQHIAEAIVRYHSGQIDIRYEGKNHKVFSIRLEGKTAVHREVK